MPRELNASTMTAKESASVAIPMSSLVMKIMAMTMVTAPRICESVEAMPSQRKPDLMLFLGSSERLLS